MAEDQSAPGAWPGYDLTCSSCGAGCRPIDRFCSQCGQRDPAGREGVDELLTAGTIVGSLDDEPDLEQFPQLAPTMLGNMYEIDELIVHTADSPPVDQTIVMSSAAQSESASRAASDARSSSAARPVSRTKMRAKKQAEAIAILEKMLVPGNVFGRRYRIQRFLGAGAMGHVASAVDDSIDEVVALKILSVPVQDEPDAFERFKNELKLARRIRHRNVVQSFDLGFADGYPYISMEYIDADNLLKHLARRTRFDEKSALTILRQVLRGLRAAHDLGIIHRDIKPENILLNKDNVAFITDFGIATTADRVRRREIAGTPDYMSPEQLRSEDVAPASDLYSCGVLLYRMLEGVLPFRATTMHGMIAAHLNDAPEPIGGEREVSAATRELVNWMLQKRMSDRPQNANEVLEKLDFQLNRERTRSASQRVTVLLAEADPNALAEMKSVLEGDGFKVLATSSAREAVNVAFEQTPSVIMLDAGIRDGFELSLAEGDAPAGADGLGFCRIVRADEKLRRVPIIVMSDPSESALKNEFSQCGAAEFVLKPLAPSEIISAVQRVRVAAMGG